MNPPHPTARPAIAGAPVRPEFFRLPSRGGDPIFGLSRSFYYAAEAEGKLRLTRLRKPGSVRGVVLVAVAAVEEMIRGNATDKATRPKKDDVGAQTAQAHAA